MDNLFIANVEGIAISKIVGIVVSVLSIIIATEFIRRRKEESQQRVSSGVEMILGEGGDASDAVDFLNIDCDFSKARKHTLHELTDLLEGQLKILGSVNLEPTNAAERLRVIINEQLAIAKDSKSFSWVHGLPIKTAVSRFEILQSEKVQTAQLFLQNGEA